MTNADRSKRMDEHVGIDSLVHNLKQRWGCRDVQVQRVPEGDDPPDYWVDVNGQRYAAEVTIITVQDTKYYQAKCRELTKEVEDAARNQGCLKGEYALEMMRKPGLPRRNSADRNSLVAKAVSFVQGTASEESAKDYLLLDDSHGHLSIRKVNAGGTAVGLPGYSEAKWLVDAREELRELMQEAVKTKRRKLENRGVLAQCPEIILVFYDAYGFCELDDAQHALLETTGYEWFHSVFWAASCTYRGNELYPDSHGRYGRFIYSKSVDWWESRTTPCT